MFHNITHGCFSEKLAEIIVSIFGEELKDLPLVSHADHAFAREQLKAQILIIDSHSYSQKKCYLQLI